MPERSKKNTHPRERDVFLEACDIDDLDARLTFVQDACGDDQYLRSRVEALLKAQAAPSVLQQTAPWLQALTDDDRRLEETVISGAQSSAAVPPTSQRWQPPSVEKLDQLFDAYRIESLLGFGGMGAVFRATQLSLQRPVAIKILPPELSDDPTFAERFRREAQSMAALDHANIVKIHFFGNVDVPDGGALFFIVMEYVDGSDLHKLLRDGPLAPDAAVRIISRVCDALHFAHESGFIHRDIKPANIFVTDDGIVKVGDFGLARLMKSSAGPLENSEAPADLPGDQESRLTMTGFLIGTPIYMAPERLKHAAEDRRGDLYSVGVMLFELVTGTMSRNLDRPITEVIGDPKLQRIICRALHSDPNLRYQHAQELKDDLNNVRRIEARSGWRSLMSARSVVLAATTLSLLLLAAFALPKWWTRDLSDEVSRIADSSEEMKAENQAGDLSNAESAAVNLVPLKTLPDRNALQELLIDSPAGSTLQLDPALSDTKISLLGQPLRFEQSLTLDGSALETPLILYGGGDSRIVEVAKGCTVRLINIVLREGFSNSSGGAVECKGDLQLVDCLLVDNKSAENGGAIVNFGGNVQLQHCIINRNTASGSGGAIWNASGRLAVTWCLLKSNAAEGSGGAIHSAAGKLEINCCDMTDNTASTSGGGVCIENEELRMSNTAVRRNHSGQNGVGISSDGAILTLTNCSIADNRFDKGGDAAIFAANDSSVDMLHCTIAKHPEVSVVVSDRSRLSLESCVVMGADDSEDIVLINRSTIDCQGVNHVGSFSRKVNSGRQPKIAREFFLSPRRHRGEIPVLRPRKTSVAIDAGLLSERTPATDLRGFPRALDGRRNGRKAPDLGAFEYDPVADNPPKKTRTFVVTSTEDGWGRDGTLRQTIERSQSGDVIEFDASLSGSTIHLRTLMLKVNHDLTIDASKLPGGIRISSRIHGGRVLQNRGVCRMINVTIEGYEEYPGNTVDNRDDLTMEDCLITVHGSTDISRTLLSNRGKLLLKRCVLAGNTTDDAGGSLINVEGVAHLENCLITGQKGGAAVRNETGAKLTLVHCTVADNDSQGVLSDLTSELTVASSIIAANRSGLDLQANGSAGLITLGENLIQKFDAATVTGADPISTDPLFGEPDHSGRLPTLPLLPDSPAIDAAAIVSETPDFDLTGGSRIVDGNGDGVAAPDLGAVEYSPPVGK